MIEELRVRGVGGIKKAHLVFRGDFIVITGESGSGKSSLVRALEFIAGKRAQINNIHTLEDFSDVHVVLAKERISELAEEYQPQENTLIARRIFGRNGRGRCTLQDVPVTLSILCSVMEKEVVIQSQFAQLGLLEPSRQLELVDSCGGEELKETRTKLACVFNEALSTEREIVALRKRRKEIESRFENAESLLRQIRALELSEDSERKWEAELNSLGAKAKRSDALRFMLERLTGGAASGGIIEGLEELCRNINADIEEDERNERRLRECAEKSLSAALELSGMLQSELSGDTAQNIEEIKERVEKKIGIVRKIKRLLKLEDCKDILQYVNEAEHEMAWLKRSNTDLAEKERRASDLRKETARLAVALRAMRKDAAKSLAAKVNAYLGELAMDYAVFDIDIEDQDRIRISGAENVSFTLSLPDQKPLSVGKTASGGELSRILIALQLSLGDDQLPGTLIFDEVEAGLGGRTALLAGYKLRQLAKRCRTILITHEATIAAMADQHFLVKREGEETIIKELSGDERKKEIARMLSGDDTSQEALDHAQALLENSNRI